MRSTLNMGKACQQGENVLGKTYISLEKKINCILKNLSNIKGFEPMVNQRLLPPTFPRYTEIRSKEGTMDYLETLLDRLVTATHVANLPSYNSALVRDLCCHCFKFITSPGGA